MLTINCTTTFPLAIPPKNPDKYFVLTMRDLVIYSKITSMIINAFFCNPITIWFWNIIVSI